MTDIPKCVAAFLREHEIPEYRIDFKNMDRRQLMYETDAIRFERLGNAHAAKKQCELKRGSAAEWRQWSEGMKDYRLLDVGCGEGYLIYFANMEGLNAEGLNLSVIEAELASHGRPEGWACTMRWKPREQRKVTVGSALKMPYADKSFDGASCTGVLMMVPHAERIFDPSKFEPLENARTTVREMARVLKTNGKLHLITMRERNKDKHPQKAEDYIAFEEHAYKVYGRAGWIVERGQTGISDLLEEAGFQIRDAKLLGEKKDYWEIKASKQV